VLEPRPGLGRALATADATAAGAAATLVVAADLPLVAAEDLDAVCAAGARGPAVVVAPTHDGGTGALLRRPPRLIPTAYGPGSAARHLALARAAGASALVVDRQALALDVDDAAGLARAHAAAPGLVPVAPR
jgi:2-phospho-L-lactate/phosphoenolpyruvate guanylyltransferase